MTIILTHIPVKGGLYASVYYFEGNIFRPLSYATKKIQAVAEQKIRAWLRENRERVIADKAKPGYLTLSKLARLAP